ncbi:hypothetical protein BDZ97DRAFT_2078959 [Flammula alnicola]|nr:hypothetical protein BDZ97DRAFT_2078959 [Flammula alnicola]
MAPASAPESNHRVTRSSKTDIPDNLPLPPSRKAPRKKPKAAVVDNEPVNSTNLDTRVAEPLARGGELGSANLVTKYSAAHADSASNTVLSTTQSKELIEPTTTNAHHPSSPPPAASPPSPSSPSSPALRRPIPRPIGRGIKPSQPLTREEEDEMFISNRARYPILFIPPLIPPGMTGFRRNGPESAGIDQNPQEWTQFRRNPDRNPQE